MIDRPLLVWVLKGLAAYLEWRQARLAPQSETSEQSRYWHGLTMAIDGIKAARLALALRRDD